MYINTRLSFVNDVVATLPPVKPRLRATAVPGRTLRQDMTVGRGCKALTAHILTENITPVDVRDACSPKD